MEKLDNVIIREDVTIKDAMQNIDKSGFGMALVVDEDMKLRGIMTDGDIRRAILKGMGLEEPISDIMNRNPFVVEETHNYNELLEEIKKRKIIGKVPVVDKKGRVQDVVLVHEKDGSLFYLKKDEEFKERLVKKVLVIGGAGYIGSILCRKLLAKGYRVKALDCLLYGDDSIKEIYEKENFEFLKGDTLNIQDVVNAIKDSDAVVHLAELVGDPLCAMDPEKTQEINFIATKLIADVSRYFQVNRFIYMSSCSVYGASQNDELLDESSALNPVSLYAKMKIQSEKAILGIVDSNFSPCIFRLATVYGLSYRPRFDLVVNVLTAKAVSEKKIPIFGGDQWRPNVNVEDVGDAIMLALEAPIDKVKGQVFNVGSEEQNHKITEIGRIVKEVIPDAELDIQEKEVDRRDYRVDFSKIRKELGFAPKKTIKDSVKEIKDAIESGSIKDYSDKKYHNYNCFKEST